MNKEFWSVWVNGLHHLVIPYSQTSVETCENLTNAGFNEIWDSAPSEFDGAQYAAKYAGAVIPVQKS
jgi:hypothetical protein